ncbi:MAG TPA: FtsX-like permease family protein [Candidatus Binatia bacterium]|nr:FtsX-like permease family protein [Candidatus Binatia bacterium]
MTAIRLLIGRLRTDRVPALLLAILVFVTALVAASAPRLFTRVADAGLRYEVAQASVVERNIQLGRITRPEVPATDGMGEVARTEATIEAALPASVRRIISGDSHFAESIVWRIPGRPSERPGFMTLQFQALDEEIRLVDGRLPTGRTESIMVEPPPGIDGGPAELPATLFEIALSTATADALGASIGDRMDLIPDPDDPLVGQFGIGEAAAADVVGIYEVVDPAADFWIGDYGLDQPTQVPVGISTVMIYSTALLSPDAYPALTRMSAPIRYTFRYYVDPERLDAGMLDELVIDLQQMEAVYASFATAPDPTRTTLQSGLLELTNSFLAERRTSEAVLTTAAIGPAAVAIAAVGVLSLLAIRRRRGALLLLRGRGTSTSQIVASHVIEGLLLTVAPAALAAALATRLVDARATPMTQVAAGAVALATIVVLAAATLPTALSSLRRSDRDEPSGIGASPRRLAFEGLAVGLAIGGVALLRQRGLAGGSAAGQLAGVDPFLAAVPALVGLAVGIVTVRLYPYPIRAAGWLAGGGRGLVPALGLRRAERQAGTGHLPLVVLLLTIAIGTFSSTMLTTIDRGQAAESWQAVGAAHRVVASDAALPAELDLTGVEGVSAVAGVHQVDASIGLAGGSRTALIALDAAEYEAVTRDTPAETRFPASFREAAGDARPGTSDAPIPAIVSRALARASTTALSVGDTFEITVTARFATFEVVELRESIPAQPASGLFVVVPRDLLRAGLIDRPLADTSLFVRAPAGATDALRAGVEESGANARVESQAERLSTLRQRPLVEAIGAGFTLALALAVAYAALAVIVSLLMSGVARARETAHLRTLGIGRWQIIGLTIVEHGPPVLVALVAGLLLGVAVAWVVLPGLGLSAFTGARVDPALAVDVGQLAVLMAALLGIVIIGVALAAWAQRRADPASAVREGFE